MAQDLESFHKDVNKLLHNIDQPSNDDDISDVDEDELLVRWTFYMYILKKKF